jgi:hypothetical protein
MVTSEETLFSFLGPTAARLVLLAAAFLFIGAADTAWSQPAEKPAGIAVNEEGGEVFVEELRAYRALDSLGIMTPDSIVVIDDDIYHGYVDRIGAPRTVHLGTLRAQYPDVELPDGFPYLFARTGKPTKKTFRRYVAVHELVHVQAAHLNAEMGRPAKGLHTESNEVQADILALVYLNHLYGTTREDLGYPAKVNYPMIPNKSVRSLQRMYCHIVKTTWSVSEMQCARRPYGAKNDE